MEIYRLRFYLHLFVKSDENLLRIRELLYEGINPNVTYRYGDTPLHSAADSDQENTRVVRELIAAGAEVNLPNSSGFMPLHYAVANRKAEVVDSLLQRGADLNATTNLTGRTALHYAINNQTPELLHILQAANPRPDPARDIAIVRMLLQHEYVDINSRDENGETALLSAVIKKDRAIVKALLARGADPNIGNSDNDSPLHMALYDREPDLSIVHLLLRYGADLHQLNDIRQTPIDIAIDGVRDAETEKLAKFFLKMVALHYELSDDTVRSIGRDVELGQFLSVCRFQVRQARYHVVASQLTVHDFILGCYNEDQFHDPFLNIYKPLIDILMTGLYSVYLKDILNGFEKVGLWTVLRHNLSLRSRAGEIREIREVRSFGELVRNCNLYRYISRLKLFELILSCSNLSDARINALTLNSSP